MCCDAVRKHVSPDSVKCANLMAKVRIVREIRSERKTLEQGGLDAQRVECGANALCFLEHVLCSLDIPGEALGECTMPLFRKLRIRFKSPQSCKERKRQPTPVQPLHNFNPGPTV
jgi:hypothetical protein